MRSITSYPRYKISDTGVVFDIGLGKEVSQFLSSDGYLKVTLKAEDGTRKTLSIHRLVAEEYVFNEYYKPEVNHIDGVKINNSYTNLEWVTHAENIKHAWDLGLIKSTPERSAKIREKCAHYGKDNPRARSVVCITTGEVFETIKDAVEKYKVQQAQISKCCQGQYGCKSAGKHPETGEKLTWKYLEDYEK